MPRDTSGVYTKPANTTAVSGATISSSDFNNLADDIATELTGSLATNGSSVMVNPLKGSAGSAAAPSLTFSSDSDTGLYSSAANKIGVAAGGSKVAEFDSTGLVEGAWTDVASASTVDLGAQSTKNIRVTGTTTITSFGTVASGVYRRVRFAAALTLTHNATSLILPNNGSNITTAAGDVLEAVSLGSGNWAVVNYQKANGTSPRGIVQVVSTTSSAVATGTGTIPSDDTIPQSTEGDQYMSLSITPTSATNKLEIDVIWNGASTLAPGTVTIALFQDTTADALAAVGTASGSSGQRLNAALRYVMTAGTTSATTFKVRAGGGAASTTAFNGTAAGTRLYGGVMASSITITEIQA